MKNILLLIAASVIVLAAVLFSARNVIARKSVEVGVEKITGFPMTVGSVDMNVFGSKLDVRNIRLTNPSDFPDKLFIEMPQLYVDYRFGSMLAGAPHLHDLFLNLEHIVIVKNAKGESNLQRLKGVGSSGGSSRKSSAKYQVEQIRIHVGKVTIKDYSRAKPTERILTLNLDRTFKDISDSTDITRLVLLSIAGSIPLPDLGINTAELTKQLGSVTDSAGKVVGGAAAAAEKAGKGIFDTIKKAVPQK